MQKVMIAGLGFMGEMHLKSYLCLADAQVVAVIDRDYERASALLKQHGFDLPIYDDLQYGLDAEPDVDVVDICLPTDMHLDAARLAAARGKHILCEKPLARNSEEARELVELAERANVRLQAAHCIRFWPEYQKLIELVKSGELGALRSLSMLRRSGRPAHSIGDWLLNAQRSGGAAYDLHIHDTDLVNALFGVPDSVFSRATQESNGDVSHIFTQYCYHDKPVVLMAEGGWDYPAKWGFDMAYQAVFEQGTVDYQLATSPTLHLTRLDGEKEPLAFTPAGTGFPLSGKGTPADMGGYVNEIGTFLRCLEEGRAPANATGPQACDTIRIVEAELASARAGIPTSIEAHELNLA